MKQFADSYNCCISIPRSLLGRFCIAEEVAQICFDFYVVVDTSPLEVDVAPVCPVRIDMISCEDVDRTLEW